MARRAKDVGNGDGLDDGGFAASAVAALPFDKGEDELEAAGRAVVDRDCASHGVDGVFDDGEAEAGATDFARAAAVDAIEALEKVGQRLVGDAVTVVGKRETELCGRL